jgi:undecaprenyl diphosphate synthase
MSEETSLAAHVAIIMDGNGRWATGRGLPRLEGHRAGLEAARRVINHLGKKGLRYVTLYTFSTENWQRPAEEIEGLFRLLKSVIHREAADLHKNNVRILHLGRSANLPADMLEEIRQAVKLTAGNTGLTLSLAFNYGGRQELVDAVRRVVADGVPVDQIDEETIAGRLYSAGLPDVDLVIRSAGEMRLSNFLLWQSAYAEYYSSNVMWPDFTAQEVDRALAAFSERKRRFGRL